jgi:hypothetical protein
VKPGGVGSLRRDRALSVLNTPVVVTDRQSDQSLVDGAEEVGAVGATLQ